MLKKVVLGLFFALLPSVAAAQGTQENYLPTKSQLYFRFDGMEKHQADFDKTAVGKMMKGETGVFLDALWNFTYDNLKTAAQNEPKVEPVLKDLTKVIVSLHKNGLVLGVELDSVKPPLTKAVIVFPKAAGESGAVLPLIHKIAEESKQEIQKTKVGKRVIHYMEIELVKFGWWGEGTDAVVFVGTTSPVDYAKDIDAKKTGITKHALYQKVAGFQDFKTASRGYLDVLSLLKVAETIDEKAALIIDQLGVKGLRNITFVSGFDGPAERSVVEVDMPSPRKGLLSMTSQKKITLNDLPVLPSDLTGFSAASINLSKFYDTTTNLIINVVKVVNPDEGDNVQEQIKAFEGLLGVNLSKDLFANFGDVMVTYSSPSDGFLGTGAVVAIQIKDGKKMLATIDKIKNAVPPLGPAGNLTLKKTKYRGGDIVQLGLAGPQINAHFASIGIYKNWFIYSQYPTALKGFILRQEGELPAWKASDDLKAALAKFPSEFTSIQVSDPRPTVQIVLGIAPIVLNLANTYGPLVAPGFRPFDLELIPHPQEATRFLFPNVTVGTDDGKRIRSETRGSLLLPF